MYDDLVRELQCCPDAEYGCSRCEHRTSLHCRETLMMQAADAIEELSRIERDFQHYISDQVKREKGVYACCYCKNRESANKNEPGCSHDECDGVSGWEYGTPKEET